MMRIALVTLCVFALTACSGEATSDPNPAGNAAKPNAKHAQNAGAKALQAKWKEHFTKCDDRWIGKTVVTDNKGPMIIYFEYANFKIAVEEQPLSEADNLNGQSFLGFISYGPNMAFRRVGFQGETAQEAEWASMTYEDTMSSYGYYDVFNEWYQYRISETNGEWDFSKAFPPTGGAFYPTTFEPANCAEYAAH